MTEDTKRLIELENSYIFEGGCPKVLPHDDHKAHIKGHKEGCSHCDKNALRHIAEHEKWLEPIDN